MIYLGENYKGFNAKVWSVEDKGKFCTGRIGTSERNQDGSYKNSTWFVTFVGKSKEAASELVQGDTITVKKCKISNETVKKDNIYKNYLNLTIFEFVIF